MTFDSVGFVGGRRITRIIPGGLRRAGAMTSDVVRSAGKVPSPAVIEKFLTGCVVRTAP